MISMAEKKTPNGDLRDVATMTQMIRHKERERKNLVERRAIAARKHKENGVTYAELGEAMNLSEMGVYKVLRAKDGPIRARKAKDKLEAEEAQ